jgi:hypothetical protein
MGIDHVIDGVATPAADADDFDSRASLWRLVTESEIQSCTII